MIKPLKPLPRPANERNGNSDVGTAYEIDS